MVGELAGDRDDVGVLQEHQPAVAVVVGERAERLGPQRDLRVRAPAVWSSDATGSVDAAHAVDRDLLDQQLVLDDVVVGRRRPRRCLRFSMAAESYSVTGSRRRATNRGRRRTPDSVATPCDADLFPELAAERDAPHVRPALPRRDDRAVPRGRPDSVGRRDHQGVHRGHRRRGAGGPAHARAPATSSGGSPRSRAATHVVHRPPAHRGRRTTSRWWSTGGRRSPRRSTAPPAPTRSASPTAAGSRWPTARSPPTSTSSSTTPTRRLRPPASPTRCSPRSAPPAPARCARSSPRSRPSRTS